MLSQQKTANASSGGRGGVEESVRNREEGGKAVPARDLKSIRGYRKMLKALEKPRSKAAREYKEWLGYNFDPTEFDLDETRGLLAEIVD